MQPVSKCRAVTLNKQLALRNLKYNWLLSDTQYWSLVKTIVPQNMHSILHKRIAFLYVPFFPPSKVVSHLKGPLSLAESTNRIYSKEPKSMTSLTFFHASINQSEVEDSFQLASDWIKSVRKNVNKHFWAFFCKYPCVICLSMKALCTQSTEVLTFVSINCTKLIRWVWCLIRPQSLALAGPC